MVLQTCHTSKLERFLDSLSEGWIVNAGVKMHRLAGVKVHHG
jgi:hypothetical protein